MAEFLCSFISRVLFSPSSRHCAMCESCQMKPEACGISRQSMRFVMLHRTSFTWSPPAIKSRVCVCVCPEVGVRWLVTAREWIGSSRVAEAIRFAKRQPLLLKPLSTASSVTPSTGKKTGPWKSTTSRAASGRRDLGPIILNSSFCKCALESWTQEERDARRNVHGGLPTNWWERAEHCAF